MKGTATKIRQTLFGLLAAIPLLALACAAREHSNPPIPVALRATDCPSDHLKLAANASEGQGAAGFREIVSFSVSCQARPVQATVVVTWPGPATSKAISDAEGRGQLRSPDFPAAQRGHYVRVAVPSRDGHDAVVTIVIE